MTNHWNPKEDVCFPRTTGLLLLSNGKKHYWSTEEDKGIDLEKKCMSRNRFQSIKQNLHLSDNSILDKNDKFAKVRPFFDVINKKNLQFGMFSFNLSIDEQMVPYFGRHSCKMFIKGKPVRLGFKLWCFCSSDGYLFYSVPYGGAQNQTHSNLGLGGDVMSSVVKSQFIIKFSLITFFIIQTLCTFKK
nr:unnamed protein product [Callosobruchus analis]